MAGSLSIAGQLTGIPTGSKTFGPLTIAANSSNDYAEPSVILSSGFNVVAVPAWAAGVVITPSNFNAVTMTLKGVTGDTGIPLNLTEPSLISFPGTPPSSFGITAGAAGVYPVTFAFF